LYDFFHCCLVLIAVVVVYQLFIFWLDMSLFLFFVFVFQAEDGIRDVAVTGVQTCEEAGYVHTARSRNDQVITDFKIWIRSSTKEINLNLDKVIKSTLKLAEKNIDTIMPGFTHLKNAQAISFAHYLMAYVEMFNRDKKRFTNNLESLDENPLGVAALTGTSFNIDRNYTSKKLGFKKPTNNSIDTVSDRDFVLDFLYSVSVCSMHISRIAEELIIWSSDGFNLDRKSVV